MNPYFDLAYYFVHNIICKQGNTQAHENRALASIENLVKQGWSLEAIREAFDSFAREYPQMVQNVFTVEQIMANKQPPDNLMDPDVFYYHNALRETSPPPRIYFDKEKREWIREEDKFFLEMKSLFTMSDLLDYWYHSNEMQPNESHIKKDKGRFDYLLDYHDLDEILFMIDIAQAERKARQLRPIRNAFDLQKYIDDAKDSIKAKKSTSRIAGIDRIIKREEVYQ